MQRWPTRKSRLEDKPDHHNTTVSECSPYFEEECTVNQLTVIENQLVPVYEDEQQQRVVNARELHEFLQSKQEFANWIKNRIEKYGFIEGEDFLTTLSKSTGGRPSREYHLKMDTAKEIAMVENNDRGREARKYFIESDLGRTGETAQSPGGESDGSPSPDRQSGQA